VPRVGAALADLVARREDAALGAGR